MSDSYSPPNLTYSPIDNINSDYPKGKLQRIFEKHCGIKFLLVVVLVTLDITELVCDWLLYYDITVMEDGLLYGKVENATILATLIFSGSGSILFSFEAINTIKYVCTGSGIIYLELISTLVIWLEEVPQTIISIVITSCHEEPISIYQIIKALLLTVSIFTRIILPGAVKWIGTKMPSKNTKCKYIRQLLSSIGLCIIFAGSSITLIFTHNITLDTFFQTRLNIFNRNPIYDKYFNNVGIYLLHRDLNFKHPKSVDDGLWLKLADYNSLSEGVPERIQITYSNPSKISAKIMFKKFTASKQNFEECFFATSLPNDTQISDKNCSKSFFGQNEQMKEIIIQLVYMPPSNHLLLGDVRFNAKLLHKNKCYKMNITNSFDTFDNLHVGILRYKRLETIINNEDVILLGGDTIQSSQQLMTRPLLVDVKNIWKTGYFQCLCQGEYGPRLNESISLTC